MVAIPASRMPRKRLAGIVASVALAAVLAGCGGAGTRTVVRVVTTPAAGPTPNSAASTTATTPSRTPSGPITQSLGKPIARETVKVPCSAAGSVRISVLELRVQGRLMTLELGFTPNDFAPPPAGVSDAMQIYDWTCNYDQFVVSLVDPVHLKRYVVVSDAAGNSLSPQDLRAPNGHQVTGDWVFAAPPPDVTSLDVQAGNFPTLTSVPIQR